MQCAVECVEYSAVQWSVQWSVQNSVQNIVHSSIGNSAQCSAVEREREDGERPAVSVGMWARGAGGGTGLYYGWTGLYFGWE